MHAVLHDETLSVRCSASCATTACANRATVNNEKVANPFGIRGFLIESGFLAVLAINHLLMNTNVIITQHCMQQSRSEHLLH